MTYFIEGKIMILDSFIFFTSIFSRHLGFQNGRQCYNILGKYRNLLITENCFIEEIVVF